MLVSAAAAQWNVPAARVRGPEPRGRARRERTQASAYGALVPAAAKLPVPKAEDAAVQARDRLALSSARTRATYDQQDIVTGKAQFGLDVYREGMVYASIEHPPVLGGTVEAFDDKAALAVKGVQQTVSARHVQAAAPVPAARRRRGDRRQHLGGDQGPQGS